MPRVQGDHDLTSIGQLCALLQRTPRAIEQAATALQLQPALRLNSVAYFSAPQVEALLSKLRRPVGRK